jgi:4-nitrophenyl phosphatase
MSKMSTNPLSRYGAFLVDIDGVLVRGSRSLEGAARGLRRLQERGRTILLTNNSSRSRAQVAEELAARGFSVAADDVVSSAYVVSRHLSREHGAVSVWVVGEEGLKIELVLAGHRMSKRPEGAEWVVAGIDRNVNYETLSDALRALSSGARLVGTNRDPTFPASDGVLPGAGSILGALEGMGFKPEAVVGKPSPIAFRAALELLDGNPTSVLMIGDRLETDIAGGARAGMDTALVFTGIADRAAAAGSAIRPTWTAESLADLADGNLSPPVL